MDRMVMVLTSLNRIDIPAGSQIRMEMYAKANEKYAVYAFLQDVSKTISGQFDLVQINSDPGNKNKTTLKKANSQISDIGKINFSTASTNIMDVRAFSPKTPVSKANLDFYKASDDKFLLSLTSNPGTDDSMVCTWRVDGKIDSAYFNTPIFGDIVRIDERPGFLIDI